MVDPKQILNCIYPPNEIDPILKNNENIDTINLYIDLKNCATGLFIEDIVKELVIPDINNSTPDSTIFQSIMLAIGNWKNWAQYRKKHINIFITNDQGKSIYHKSIIPEYKSNRNISNTTLAKYQEELNVVRHKNFDLSELISNKLKNVYFFNLKFLESDFLSYYLISRLYKNNNNILHIIASNDKDHYQTLNLPNTIMINKRSGIIKIYDKSTILKEFSKLKSDCSIKKELDTINIINKIDSSYIPIIMAFTGDISDNVPGIKGVGNITALKMFSDNNIVSNLIGTLDNAIDNVYTNKLLLDETKISFSKLSKQWQTAILNNNIITNAFRAISYELLCRYLEEKNTTKKIELLEYIDSILNKSNIQILNENTKNDFIKMFKTMPNLKLNESDILNLV